MVGAEAKNAISRTYCSGADAGAGHGSNACREAVMGVSVQWLGSVGNSLVASQNGSGAKGEKLKKWEKITENRWVKARADMDGSDLTM